MVCYRCGTDRVSVKIRFINKDNEWWMYLCRYCHKGYISL